MTDPSLPAPAANPAAQHVPDADSWDERGDEEVGVGPWSGPWPTGAEAERYDPDLLRAGDRRNVVDRYRYWRLADIVADLDARRAPLHVALENTGHDFNVGSVVRTANAFNVAGVHIVGRRRWNRRGAMVTDRYLHIHHHPTPEDLIAFAAERALPLVGVDNLPGAEPLPAAALPAPAILCFGTEGPGLSPALWAACALRVEIPQAGSTRSINLGAAAAIVMYHWATQHVWAGGA